jgi:cellobiose phosphorylase
VTGEPLEPQEAEVYGHWETTAESYSASTSTAAGPSTGAALPDPRAAAHGHRRLERWHESRVGAEGSREKASGWAGSCTPHWSALLRLCERLGDQERAKRYRQRARELQDALEAHAWDGEWYLRAYYDDGTPLGSADNRECQIDSLAQSWAVLSGAGDKTSRQAGDGIGSRAPGPVRRPACCLLFTPPFDKTPRDPGYIKGYPPGIRENGGQYTHAALWAVWAFAELGDGDRAGELYRMLNPIYHSDSPEGARAYQVEPYVMAADVYGAPPHTGKGGWTWYTGSGGWTYRLGLEAILGFRRRGNVLRLRPHIPAAWPGYQLTYRWGQSRYHIQVSRPGRPS